MSRQYGTPTEFWGWGCAPREGKKNNLERPERGEDAARVQSPQRGTENPKRRRPDIDTIIILTYCCTVLDKKQ